METKLFVHAIPNLTCCEVFFKCEETISADGNGFITDSITGAKYQATNPNYDDTAYGGLAGVVDVSDHSMVNGTGQSNCVYSIADTPVQLIAGRWPNFKNRNIILFSCGRVVDATKARAPIGYGAGNGNVPVGNVSLSFGGGMHGLVLSEDYDWQADPDSVATSTGDATAASRVLTNGNDVGLILEVTKGNPGTVVAKAIDINGNTFGSGTTETLQSVTGTLTKDIDPGVNNRTRLGGLAFYSIMAFSFDGALPSNRNQVYKWLMQHHVNGKRFLPPAWVYEASSR